MASPNTSAEADQLNDTAGTANNNSILGKMKSTVKGIFPTTISKWFSPGPQNSSGLVINESINGGGGNLRTARRRRHEEIEREEDEDDDLDLSANEEEEEDEEDEQTDNTNETGEDQNDSEESEENAEGRRRQKPAATKLQIRGRRSINHHQSCKRRRVDNNDDRDDVAIPLPINQSTPTNSLARDRRSRSRSKQSRASELRGFKHIDFKKTYQNLPGYDMTANNNCTQASLISKSIYFPQGVPPATMSSLNNNDYISPRRVLNLPQSNQSLQQSSLKSLYNDLPTTSAAIKNHKRNTFEPAASSLQGMEEDEDNIVVGTNNNKYNGNPEKTLEVVTNKRLKLLNGSAAVAEHLSDHQGTTNDEAAGGGPCDSSDGGRSSNIGRSNKSLNGSRNSLLACGINFNANLEGRKSLFSSSQQSKNSSFSLHSWNQKQFNPSIYGSNSVLSDSRLLKKLSGSSKESPKITTTYGGAAAGMKFLESGAGARFTTLTPTQIRPTSSMSSLNSSNNSGFRGSLGSINQHVSNTSKSIMEVFANQKTPLGEAKKMGSSSMRTPAKHHSRLSDADLYESRKDRLNRLASPYGRPLVPSNKSRSNVDTVLTNSGVAPPVKELTIPTKVHLMKVKKLQSSTEHLRQIALESGDNNFLSDQYELPIQEESESRSSSKMKIMASRRTRVSNMTNSRIVEEEEAPPSPPNLPNVVFPTLASIPKIDIDIPISRAPMFASSAASVSQPTQQQQHSTTISSWSTLSANENSMAVPTTSSFAAAAASSLRKPESTPAANSSSVTASTNAAPTTAKPMFQFNTASFAAAATPAKQQTSNTTSTTTSSPIATTATSFRFGSPTAASFNGGINSSFKFSMPIKVNCVDKQQTAAAASSNVKINFSNAMKVQEAGSTSAAPKLKTGSCLEVFKMSANQTSSSEKEKQAAPTTGTITSATTATTSTFGTQFQKQSGEWECDTCMIRNKAELVKCIACETPKKAATTVAPTAVTTTPLSSSFGGQFKKSGNEWDCDTCMIRNKADITKCVACETPKPGSGGAASTSDSSAMLPAVKQNFGDAFKAKPNTWECPTCMINNKSEANACVACNTNKPGSSGSTGAAVSTTVSSKPAFTFGFAPSAKTACTSVESSTSTTTTSSSSTSSVSKVNQDDEFKKIASAQKSSSWECEACMTRNDAGRKKCICCEQAKPGTYLTESESAPSFKFGATASAFQFGSASSSSSILKTDTKSPSATGFSFGTVSSTSGNSASGGFSFGVKANTTTSNTSKTETSTSSAGTSETDGNKLAASSSTTASTVSGFKFGVSSTNVVSSSTTTTTAASTFTTATTGGFSFGLKPAVNSEATPNKDAKSETENTATTKPSTPKPLGGFSFTTSTSTSSSSASTMPLPTFSFGSPAAKTPASTTAASTATTTNSTPATTTFSFGSSKPQNNDTTNVSSSQNSDSNANATKSEPKTLFGTPANANLFALGSSTSAATTSTSAGGSMGAFGGFGAASSSPAAPKNIFGSFGGTGQSVTESPNVAAGASSTTATTTASSLFGNTSSLTTTTASSSSSTTTGFVFGSASTGTPTFGSPAASAASSSSATVTTSTSSTTPKPFVFGSASSTPATFGSFAAAAANNTSINNNPSSSTPNFFGSNAAPGSSNTNNNATFGTTPSLFGSSTGNALSNSSGPSSLFGAPLQPGSGGLGQPNPPAFGAISAFGSTPSKPNDMTGNTASGPTALSAFGSTMSTSAFGGNTSATPTFGSFSSTAKPEPFKFGDPSTASPNLFSFGANNNSGNNEIPKPAFKFGATTTAPGAFTFSSPASSLTTNEQQTSAPTMFEPFRFGATNFTTTTSDPSNPTSIFKFGGGAFETPTPSAPFQFNAAGTVASATNNIFAPLPTGSQGPGQAPRRKIRAAVRRMTPR